MSEPVIAQKSPYGVDVEAGKAYAWCACGRRANQPVRDGSHSDTGSAPLMYTAEKSETAFFRGCKRSADRPLCDGGHSSL